MRLPAIALLVAGLLAVPLAAAAEVPAANPGIGPSPAVMALAQQVEDLEEAGRQLLGHGAPLDPLLRRLEAVAEDLSNLRDLASARPPAGESGSDGSAVIALHARVIALTREFDGPPRPVRRGTPSRAAFAGAGSLTGSARTPAGEAIPGVTLILSTASVYSVATTQSAADGTFSFTGLASGEYYVRTQNAAGLLDQIWNGDTPCLVTVCSGGIEVSVVDGGETGGVDFRLGPGGRISGRITATDGTPVVGAWVRIDPGNWRFVITATTNSSGDYITGPGLPTGTYVAEVGNRSGYLNQLSGGVPCIPTSCDHGAALPIAVPEGTTHAGLDFVLEPGGRISGAVFSAANGLPLAGVGVYFYTTTGSSAGVVATTDAAGAYVSGTGLPTGDYVVMTRNESGHIDQVYPATSCVGGIYVGCATTDGTPIPATLGATTGGIDFALNTGARIAGTLTDAATGAPVQGKVTVHAGSRDYLGTAIANAAGEYVTGTGLPPGEYFVRTFGATGYVDQLFQGIPCPGAGTSVQDGCDATLGTPVQVSTGNAFANFALSTGGSITGQVLAADTGLPLSATGAPAVLIYDHNGRSLGSTWARVSDGVFVLTGLPTGLYYLKTKNALGYVDEIHDGSPCLRATWQCNLRLVTPVAVTAGTQTSGVDFLLNQGASISGRVTDAETGEALGSVIVTVYDVSGQQIDYTSTTSSGHYSTGGLTAGTYFLRLRLNWRQVGVYIAELDGVQPCHNCLPTRGTPAVVGGQGSTTVLDFPLLRGSRMTGVVRDNATGTPIPNARVTVYDLDGNAVTSGTADAAGSYAADAALPPGTYYASASASGYASLMHAGIPCTGQFGCSPISYASPATPIEVALGQSVAIDFMLSSTGSGGGTPLPTGTARITGWIRDAVTGAGVSDASVQFTDSQNRSFGSVPVRFDGGFRSPPLPSGTYTLTMTTVWTSVYVGGSRSGVTATNGATTSGIVINVNRKPLIRGRVTDAQSGHGLTARVDVFNSTGGFSASAYPDPQGYYAARLDTAGSYFLRTRATTHLNEVYANVPCPASCTVTTGTAVTIAAGSVTNGINFELDRGGLVSGRVSDSVTGAHAYGTVSFFNGSGALIASATVDLNGRYLAEALSPGSYYVKVAPSDGHLQQAWPDTLCDEACTPHTSGATPVSVTAGSATTGIDFPLTRGGTISGMVTAADTGARLEVNVSIQVYDAARRLVATGYPDYNSRFYRVGKGLPAGTYYVKASSSSSIYMNELYGNVPCGVCDVTTGTPVSVTTGNDTTGIDMVLDRIRLTVGDASVVEGAPGQGRVATVTITTNYPHTGAMTVTVNAVDGTALANSDYTQAPPASVTIPPNATSTTFAVGIVGDDWDEETETFGIQISSYTPVLMGPPGTVTIVDDDAPKLSVSDAAVTETDEGLAMATFTITRSGPSSARVLTAAYATANGTATAGSDYQPTSGTVTLNYTGQWMTVTVPVVPDNLVEGDETFVLNLTGTLVDRGQGVATIVDDDLPPPSLSIGDVSLAEGNTGASPAVLTLSLSAPATETVTVAWSVGAAGTATAGSDYTAASGSVTFAAGESTRTIGIDVVGDLLDEANETFFVNLSGVSGAVLADGQARVTIADDDDTPSVFFTGGPNADGNRVVTEGDTGNVSAAFAVSLSAPSARVVKVTFATGTAGTATLGSDYAAKTGILTFDPGQTSKAFTVQVLPDADEEIDEVFYVNLSGQVNCVITDVQAMGTIVDNDPAPAGSPNVSISDSSVSEPGNGSANATFTISLSAASIHTVTVPYNTGTGGTAAAGFDYVFKKGTLTFAPGETVKIVNVQVLADAAPEPAETLYLNLASAAFATIVDGQGKGTIAAHP